MTPDFEWAFRKHSPELITSLDDGTIKSYEIMMSLQVDNERFKVF